MTKSDRSRLVLDKEAELAAQFGHALSHSSVLSSSQAELLDLTRPSFHNPRTVARIYRSASGGPVRTIINGRHIKTTGIYSMIKAGGRAMPWESEHGEMPFMRLAEVATPVRSFLAQPHLLVMRVRGQQRFWRYFPDAEMEVDVHFADQLDFGFGFDEAVAAFQPAHVSGATVRLIIEVKRADDRRLYEPDYRAKIKLASLVYRGLGYRFHEVQVSPGTSLGKIARSVHEFSLDHSTKLTPEDIYLAKTVAARPGAKLHDLFTAFGSRQLGKAKAAALHVRRVIMVDLRHDLHPATPIHLMPEQGKGAWPGVAA